MGIIYDEQNPYIPDPALVAEMDATVVIPCRYDKNKQVWDWLVDSNITFRFRNQWSDEKGVFASFTIMDEKERMLFLLRWT